MKFNEIPTTRPIRVTDNVGIAALALDSILRPSGARFTCMEVITGAPQSGRVLRQKPGRDTVPIPPCTGEGLARDLQKLILEARFDPSEKLGGKKGWSIEEAIVDGLPVAIVWCVWVP